MSIKPVKLDVRHLELGMYIASLDRPWHTAPFAIHGFYIRDLSEIKKLKLHCNHVYIDIVKGIAPSDQQLLSTGKKLDPSSEVYGGKLKAIYIDTDTYPGDSNLSDEMPLAKKAYQQLMDATLEVMAQITRKQTVSLDAFLSAAYGMVDSISRNPDAFMWLVRVRKTDEKEPFYHLLRSSAWAIVFARHLGLSKPNMRIVVLSTLLREVGRLTLPKVLLSSKAGDPSQSGVGQIIVDQTVATLKTLEGLHPKVIKTISMMYERLNGSGYPQKLQGDEIPFLSKVASLSVFYDEVTYLKGELCSIPSSQSISRLYDARGKLFQDDLVVEFIKAFGLYPTGTLAKLSTGEVGVVTEQNRVRRLKPRVIVIVDKEGKALEDYSYIDLMVGDARSIVPPTKSRIRKAEAQIPSRVDIIEDVQPYDYPIKVTKIRETHINNMRPLHGR